MPLRIGVLAYPALMMVLVFMQKKGAVGKFLKAGAVSADTARKPASLQITNRESVEAAVKSGVLVATGDGRYFVDVIVYRRKRNLLLTVLGLIGLLLAVFFFWVLRR